MLIYQGKYNSAKVMIDVIDETTVAQIYNFLNQEFLKDTNIVIMPDCHAGKGAVIGFTATANDYICPSIIGVDIGCGIEAYKLGKVDIDFAKLDTHIREFVPSGFEVRRTALEIHPYEENTIRDVCKAIDMDGDYALKSLGTLGGGNHFIEIDIDELGNYWLLIHTGSRNFGKRIAEYHQSIAGDNELAYLSGVEKQNYLNHMVVAQQYASANRGIIAKQILRFFNMTKPLDYICSVHNYYNFTDNIMRKGAISADMNQPVIIPLNMKDGCIIGLGKGNAKWNNSAPHGAGRILSRGQAKRSIKLEDFQDIMKGVWTSCVNEATLDESPFAYKDKDLIIEAIKPTVRIIDNIKPVYNFKASEDRKKRK